MPAAIYDMTIEQGANFDLTLTLRTPTDAPYDLTGYTGRGQLRTSYSAAEPAAAFAVSIPAPATSGTVKVSLTAAQTASLPARSLVYDIELVNADGYVLRIIQGTADVSPEATR